MKVICFGELMIRYNPPGYNRFVQTPVMEFNFGGAEANVAVSLAGLGVKSSLVTKLPSHEIGQAAVNILRRYGVETNNIVRGGERVGIYYVEKGAAQRPSKVIYDRKYSAIAMAEKKDFEWDRIFDGADWFHFTGITPALGDNVAEICLEACKTAKEMHIPVSCDLNFRKNLWSSEKAGRIMGGLMPYVDLCIANEEDADKVFGIRAADTDIDKGILNHEGYISVAQQIAERFGCKRVAFTLRGSISASDNDWAGMLYDSKSDETVFSNTYRIHIVDRVGGGDSFGAGLIYAALNGFNLQDSIEFAVAASALKHTIEGDFNFVTADEVNALVKGGGTGRIQR
ncbi:MAG: sugar kinase [Oscillospiraceae bacterium]|nr:sugar kinase [Oscillospiraceae bacterium]